MAIDPELDHSQATNTGGQISASIAKSTPPITSVEGQSFLAPCDDPRWDLGATATTPGNLFPTPPPWPRQGDNASSTPPPWAQSSSPAQSLPPLSAHSEGRDINLAGFGATPPDEQLHEQPSGKFRISITMTCDQHQLMTIMTHLGQYGTNPSINIQEG